MVRTMCRLLVEYDQIGKTTEWVESQIPEIVRKYAILLSQNDENCWWDNYIDMNTVAQVIGWWIEFCGTPTILGSNFELNYLVLVWNRGGPIQNIFKNTPLGIILYVDFENHRGIENDGFAIAVHVEMDIPNPRKGIFEKLLRGLLFHTSTSYLLLDPFFITRNR